MVDPSSNVLWCHSIRGDVMAAIAVLCGAEAALSSKHVSCGSIRGDVKTADVLLVCDTTAALLSSCVFSSAWWVVVGACKVLLGIASALSSKCVGGYSNQEDDTSSCAAPITKVAVLSSNCASYRLIREDITASGMAYCRTAAALASRCAFDLSTWDNLAATCVAPCATGAAFLSTFSWCHCSIRGNVKTADVSLCATTMVLLLKCVFSSSVRGNMLKTCVVLLEIAVALSLRCICSTPEDDLAACAVPIAIVRLYHRTAHLIA